MAARSLWNGAIRIAATSQIRDMCELKSKGELVLGEEVVLGRSVTQHKQVSDVTAHAIDEEVRRVIQGNFQRARQILTSSLDKLHLMADALMKYETIDEEQLKDIMAGKPPKPPKDWDDTLSNKPPKSPAEGTAAGGPIGSPA